MTRPSLANAHADVTNGLGDLLGELFLVAFAHDRNGRTDVDEIVLGVGFGFVVCVEIVTHFQRFAEVERTDEV